LKKVTKQDNFGDIIEISDDELDEETSKEAGVFVEATSKEDALSTMHLKSHETEPASLQEPGFLFSSPSDLSICLAPTHG